MERNLNKISFILGHLAVGSRGCAEDQTTLLKYKIGAILSLTATVPGLEIPHLTVEIQDRHPLPEGVIHECVEFIDYHRQQGERVLVHCEMGISRSPAICACYLHECADMTPDEAHLQIKTQHPIADPHPMLLASIKDYYDEKFKRSLERTVPSFSGDDL